MLCIVWPPEHNGGGCGASRGLRLAEHPRGALLRRGGGKEDELCWTRSHPERSNVPPNCWDQHQWGIYLADRFCGPQPSANNLDFPTLQRFSPISHQTIAEGAISPQDWVWSAMGPAPLLGSLTRAITALHTNTDHRDDSRARREATPKWGDVSAHHGAVAWQLTKKVIASRARKIRHL